MAMLRSTCANLLSQPLVKVQKPQALTNDAGHVLHAASDRAKAVRKTVADCYARHLLTTI